MKKKGFTLIELLAVIVILAIIALIIVPITQDVIEKAEKGAAKDSAYGYKESVNKLYHLNKLEDSSFEEFDGEYTIDSNGNLKQGSSTFEISATGKKPSSGTLTYEDNTLKSGCLVINGYEVRYQNEEFTTTGKGDCGVIAPQEKILYLTYGIDVPATQLDSSWNVYLKTTIGGYAIQEIYNEYPTLSSCEQDIYNSYDECININGTYKIKAYYGIFTTIQECESYINESYTPEDIEAGMGSCIELNDNLLENDDFPANNDNFIKKEVCGVFSNGTVCLEPNKWEGENGGSYIQSKKIEFETAIGGGYTCDLSNMLFCSDNNNLSCDAGSYGAVECNYDNIACSIYEDGSASCFSGK